MPALLLVEFLVFLKRFIPDRQEYDELVKYLEEILDNCDESYKKSPDFKRLITSTSSSISQDEKKLHVYIAHLVCDLQAHVKHPTLRGDGREAKKSYGDRNPGYGSERLPQKRARRANEDGDVGIDLPGDGIIRDNYNRKEASSAVVREDHCRGHSSTRTTDVSTLNSAPKLVALQPAKIDSVSSAKRADVHPVATSTSHQERTVKPSCSKEADCMSVADDKMSVIPQNRDEERNILLSFLACLKSLIQDPQLFDDIRKYIKRLFSQCDESFRKSSDFRQLVRSAKSAVSNDKERLFPHLLDFTAKLKSHSKNSRGPVPGELLKQKANDDKREPEVRAEVPNVERVTENNAESPYNEEVTSSCSPSVSPAKKPKRDVDAAKSEKIWIVLERNATSKNGSSTEIVKRADDTDPQRPLQDDDDSPVMTAGDGSECYSLPKSAGLGKSIPTRKDLHSTKVESLSTPFSSSRSENSPLALTPALSKAVINSQGRKKKMGSASGVADTMKHANASSEASSSCKETAKVKPSLNKDRKLIHSANLSSNSGSTSEQKAKVQPSCSKSEQYVNCGNTSSNTASTSKHKAKVKPSFSKDQDSVSRQDDAKARSKPESTSEQKAKVKSSGIHRKVSVKSAVTSKKKPKAEAKPSFREDQDDGKIFVSERQITELENHLGVLRDKIEKLKEREMSLDDLDKVNSCYIYQYKLERKFVEVWNKLCELIGRSKATGRPTEKRFRFDGTRFPEINKKIRRFIDSKKNFFPDLNDITEIIIQVNKKKKLHLSSKSVEEISKVAFQDVGDLLKDRRWNDFLITFGCRLTDHVDLNDDPALTDPELEARLERNRSEGKKRLDEIFRKYTREQEAEELANQSRKEKEEESSRSPTNEEEEQVRAPEHHPVPYEAVGHQVEDNCTGINMEGNEGLLNVLKLTTDEDKEDVRLDEDNEKDERTSAL